MIAVRVSLRNVATPRALRLFAFALAVAVAFILLWSEYGFSFLDASSSPAVVHGQLLWLLVASVPLALMLDQVLLHAVPLKPAASLGWLDALAVAVLLLLESAWIWNLGFYHYGGYEHAIIGNIGWLQMIGQRPCIDFPCTLHPLFFLGARYAMEWFGVSWKSAVLLGLIYGCLTCAWSYLLLRALAIGRFASAAVALLAQATTLMFTCYWWYNNVASVTAVILLLSALAWLRRPRSWICTISFGTVVFLSLLDKPNGWPFLGIAVLVFCLLPTHRLRAFGCIGAAFLGVLVTASVTSIDLVELLRTYNDVRKTRGPGLLAVRHSLDFQTGTGYVDVARLVLLTLFFALAAWTGWRKLRRREVSPSTTTSERLAEAAIYAGAYLTGVAYFFTNFELKIVDATVPVVAAAVYLLTHTARQPSGWVGSMRTQLGSALVIILLTATLLQGLMNGWNRYRVLWINEGFFWEPRLSVRQPALDYFHGLHSGDRLVRVVDQLNQVVRENPDANIFFGPWLQFAYPAFRREPATGFPVWWHEGTSYLDANKAYIWDCFRKQQFDVLVFIKGGYYGMPSDFSEDISFWYMPDERLTDLTLFRPIKRPQSHPRGDPANHSPK